MKGFGFKRPPEDLEVVLTKSGGAFRDKSGWKETVRSPDERVPFHSTER